MREEKVLNIVLVCFERSPNQWNSIWWRFVRQLQLLGLFYMVCRLSRVKNTNTLPIIIQKIDLYKVYGFQFLWLPAQVWANTHVHSYIVPWEESFLREKCALDLLVILPMQVRVFTVVWLIIVELVEEALLARKGKAFRNMLNKYLN